MSGTGNGTDEKMIDSKIDLNYVMSYGFLAHVCPQYLIGKILTKHNKLSQRFGLLPAAAVVYFVITMSLWREEQLEKFLKILVENINFVNNGKNILTCPGKLAILEARTKLGAVVMRSLANEILKPIAPEGLNQAWYKKMRLMAFNGSTFDLPDESVNAVYFGYPSAPRGDEAFPQARVLSLVETGTRVVTAAEIGPYRRSVREMALAIIESGKLREDMLLLADRSFYGYKLWSKALSSGAKILWRVKTNLILPVEERLSDGSYLSTVSDSTVKNGCVPLKVRVVEYNHNKKSPADSSASVGEVFYRLFTNVFDCKIAPAHELASLYHERLEIETLFAKFKIGMCSNSTVIRSKSPMLVEQELWGLIILHFALRQLMSQAAFERECGSR
jgi:hypothetical protein